MVLRLPEDAAQVVEERFGHLLNVVFFSLVDQEEHGLRSAESIRPLFHLEGVLELQLPDLEQLAGAFFVLKQHGVWDLVLLVLLHLLGGLAGLQDVLEVLMEGLGDAEELLLALVLEAELEQALRTRVVLLHHAAVLTQRVQDD